MASLSVALDFGKHTINEPKGMRRVLEDVFQKAGLSGNIQVAVGARIRGSNHSKEVFIRRLDKSGKKISFTIQSNGKDSKHVCVISVPSQFRDDPELLVNRLYLATQDERYVAPTPVQKPDKPTFDFSEKGIVKAMDEKTGRMYAKEELTKENCQNLIVLIDDLYKLTGNNSRINNAQVRAVIRSLGLNCEAKNIYLHLLFQGYIKEERYSPKRSWISLTDKAIDLIKAGTSRVAAEVLEEKVGLDENIKQVLADISKKAERHKSLTVLLESVKSQVEDLTSRLEEKMNEQEGIEKELDTLQNAQKAYEEAISALGLKL